MRKVLKLGRSTLAVTLPRDWVNAFSLKQGDYLAVDQTDSGALKLAIGKQEVEEAPRVCVINADLCELPNMLTRMVIGAYVVGHKMIWIQSRTRFKSEHVQELDGLTLSLVGLHVSERTENLIILQSLADPSKPTMDNSIRRLHLISSFMRESVAKALTAGTALDLPSVLAMGKEGERVYWLVVRQLLSSVYDRKLAEALGIRSQYWLLGDRAVLSNLKAVVNCAEAVAKEAANVLELGICLQNGTVAEIARLDSAIAEVSEGAISSLITRDVARANELIQTIMKLEEDANRIEDSLSEMIQAPLCRSRILRVIHGFKEIVSRQRTIAEIAINRALEESGDYASIDAGFFTRS